MPRVSLQGDTGGEPHRQSHLWPRKPDTVEAQAVNHSLRGLELGQQSTVPQARVTQLPSVARMTRLVDSKRSRHRQHLDGGSSGLSACVPAERAMPPWVALRAPCCTTTVARCVLHSRVEGVLADVRARRSATIYVPAHLASFECPIPHSSYDPTGSGCRRDSLLRGCELGALEADGGHPIRRARAQERPRPLVGEDLELVEHLQQIWFGCADVRRPTRRAFGGDSTTWSGGPVILHQLEARPWLRPSSEGTAWRPNTTAPTRATRGAAHVEGERSGSSTSWRARWCGDLPLGRAEMRAQGLHARSGRRSPEGAHPRAAPSPGRGVARRLPAPWRCS